jgi:hypothetical protein
MKSGNIFGLLFDLWLRLDVSVQSLGGKISITSEKCVCQDVSISYLIATLHISGPLVLGDARYIRVSQWFAMRRGRGRSLVRTPPPVPRLVQYHARTSCGFNMVPRKSMCLVAVCMAMRVRPLEHISCCVFVWGAIACLVLWAGVLGFRDILDNVRCAVR